MRHLRGIIIATLLANVTTRHLRVIIIAILLATLLFILEPVLLHQRLTRTGRRDSCMNSLKQIAIALHSYHDTYGSLPPAYVADKQGRPMHSWRVLILPFLDYDYGVLYERYDFGVAWDHPNNRYVLEHMPPAYSCYRDPDRDGIVTSYFAPFGSNCAFQGAIPTRFRDMTDGQPNTILVGEAIGLHVPWTKPQDIDTTMFPRLGEKGGFRSVHDGGTYFVFGDGATRFVLDTIEQETLRNLFNINDGNEIPDF